MRLTTIRPKGKNKRFYQLEFKGFKSKKNFLLVFVSDLSSYVVKKIRKLFALVLKIIKLGGVLPSRFKDYMVRKLIWSRGKLGRPIVTVSIMIIALVVFTFGEVLNSSSLVSAGEVSPDYLSNVNDIIPNLNTAMTVVPESRKRAESFEYTVVSGDTLSSIGNKFKISVDAIKYVNNLTDSSILKIGQVVVIPPISGLIHEVEEGDTLASIAETYNVPSQAIADFNYILDTSSLAVGSELVIPGAKVPEPVYVAPLVPSYVTAPPLAQAAPSSNYCVWPTTTRIITQYFSWYHNGLDIAVPHSWGMPPIFSCREGTIVRAGWDPFGLGLHVRIDHGDGYETVYGHMSALSVSYGQRVSRGSQIGIMGNTGRSTGPHVHYMIKFNGIPQNPLNYTN